MSWWLAAVLAIPVAAQIPDSQWRLVTAPKGLPTDRVTLTVSGDRISFRGCNSHSGTFRIEGRRLIVDRMAATMMACTENGRMELDQRLARTLENATFRITGKGPEDGRLDLRGSNGDRWRFHREPQPSAAATTKFIQVAATTKPCTGVAVQSCLQVSEKPGEPWRLHYGPIIGFDYVPGIEYRLRIKEDRRTGPIPADASLITWYLDLIVEQKVVDAAAVEAHRAAEAQRKKS